MTPKATKLFDIRLVAAALVAAMGCAASPTTPDLEEDLMVATEEEREEIATALNQELQRSLERLRIDDYETPYFLSYHLRDEERYNVSARYGALVGEDHDRQRYAYVETRVGDYDFDNFADVDAQSWRTGDFRADRIQPIDSDVDALRGALWLLTDETYKRALSDYQTKRGGAVYQADQDLEVPSFSKEDPREYRSEPRPLQIDKPQWRELVRDVTAEMREHEFLMDAKMDVSARRQVRYLVNSEGTDIIDEFTIYSVQAQAFTRADDGMLLENSRQFYALDGDELPDEETIREEVDQMIADLEALREAEVLDPFTGPAVLDPQAAGVLFHEALGHRLEGERQRDDAEGRTFTGHLDSEIMPEFLSVYDDPTLQRYDGVQLNGHYLYDDEGVKAQRASLVEDGVLTGFLMSRTPIEGFERSTGHARAQGVSVPQARMANFIVEADEEKAVSDEELIEKLKQQARDQGEDYGLLIQDVTGGSTNTLGFGYQAFKGVPRMIYKVDAETGEKTLVRGAELVGTPLSAINEIEAVGDQPGVFNGFCGAESGQVPVSAVAPAMLTAEIELQRSSQIRERDPILPPPWADNADEQPEDEYVGEADGDDGDN